MVAMVIVDVVHSNVARPFSYLVPEGMEITVGFRVLVPLGPRTVSGFVVELADQPADDVPFEKLKPVIRRLDPWPALLPSLLKVAEDLALETHCPLAETLRLMLPASMRTGSIQVKTRLYAALSEGVDCEKALADNARSAKRKILLNLLTDGRFHAVDEMNALVNNPREAIHALEKQGCVRIEEREAFRPPDGIEKIERTFSPVLTDEQLSALNLMLPMLKEGKGACLLHGVTGSGKTEVFLSLVQHALEEGKGAIILVPEIALTPQMVRWFCSRFGPQTAVLHSRLTDGQRYDEWRRIRCGDARVVVGARSAVFAPVENLGLIVIDEEHEQTYLSDKHPRYDARQIAMSRAQNEGAMMVLSSATPSILSFAKARRGDYSLVEMPHRVNNHPMPCVTVVDMRKELESGNRSLFSRELIQKLKTCLDSGNQAMLFLNRRGFNTFVSCRSCGYVVKCNQCDLTMTLHKQSEEDRGILRCHMCGAVSDPPEVCPECGSKYIRYFGSGTERVEEEMHKLFPGVETVRMDNDTTQERNAHASLLERFGSGRARVLIGTQMIAKGLDFPKVTLVGVISADMTLNLPDFRSRERTFQLITQVAGRAGRADIPGEVIVQTYKPEDPCIEAAAAQDYRSFFEMEFNRRRSGLYPPFTLLARLLVQSESEETAKLKTEELYNVLQTYLLSHPIQKKRTLMIRADEAPVKRIRGLYRYHVLMKLLDHPDTKPLTALMAELASTGDERCHIFCEINPVTMM